MNLQRRDFLLVVTLAGAAAQELLPSGPRQDAELGSPEIARVTGGYDQDRSDASRFGAAPE